MGMLHRLRSSHASRTRLIVSTTVALVLSCLMIVAATSHSSVAASAAPAIQVISPVANSTIDGTVSFSFRVQNLDPNSYEAFWSVDNGHWNRMQPDKSDPTVNQAMVAVGNWRWQPSGNYTVSLIALKKSDNQPIIQNVPVHVGSPDSLSGIPISNNNVQNAQITSLLNLTTPKPLYTDPTSDVALQSQRWSQTHPNDAAIMHELANQPLVSWYGDWNNNVQNDVNTYVSKAQQAQAMPVLVAYNIPERDCGSYSAGGAANASAYATWIAQFAAGIGQRDALVILEPDALAGMDCLSHADQQTRLDMLQNAVKTLKSQTNASVYIDAGNPNWQTPQTMAARLKVADITDADGFSLNVSNFVSTQDNISYGTTLSGLVGNAHFVIDTSRNGNGAAPDNAWCNPSGRSVGQTPTRNTGNAIVDAYLWVKAPGGSDGSCGASESGTSAPSAGAWWPEYALNLFGAASQH